MQSIFLLEDDAALGRGIAMALAGPKQQVTQAGSIDEAERTLSEMRFSLWILDVNLPDGSGLDLLRAMRQRGDRTPAILLTANDLELDEVTGLEAGRGRLYHQALFAGGAARAGQRPAAARRAGAARPDRAGRFCV